MFKSRVLLADDNAEVIDAYQTILAESSDDTQNCKNSVLAMFDTPSETDIQIAEKKPPLDEDLEDIDFQLVSCSQGADAIDQVAQSLDSQKQFAVAFIDMRMPPGIDGLETIKQMYNLDPAIQIVVVTAYSDYSSEQIRHALNPSDNLLIVKKPFDVIEIRQLAITLSRKWHLDKKVADKNQELQKVNAELLKAKQEYQKLFDLAPVGYVTLSPDGNILRCNQYFSEYVGVPIENIIQREFVSFLSMEYRPKFLARLTSLQNAAEKTHCTMQLFRKGGKMLFAKLGLEPVRDANGNYNTINLTITDVTDFKLSESMLVHQAFHDSLTNLSNRKSIEDSIAKCISFAHRRKQQFCLLYLDLDNFKNVNDSMGHDIGDQLLIKVTELLMGSCRGENTIARVGGDEFAILQPTMEHISEAHELSSRILNLLGGNIKVQGTTFNVGCSIGIAVYPQDGDSTGELLKKADIAMYEAKQKGKNNYVLFSKDLEAQVINKLQTEKGLIHAIEHNEFKIFYQPKLKIANNEVFGMEALIRWHNPAGKIIPPVQFIELAEQSGLISRIGTMVLYMVAADIKAWTKAGKKYHVAINLSPIQLLQYDLLDNIKKIFCNADIDSSLIDFEVTESVFIGHADDSIARLSAIKELGFGIAIDDFGTGYSSFAYLKQLPISVLKIDKLFVDGIPDDKVNMSLVKAMVTMGKGLGMRIVAEGVESEHQLEALKKIGCDEYQGYYYSKPLPYSQLVDQGKL